MTFTKEDSAKTKGIAVILLLFHHLFFTDRGFEVNLQYISEDTLRALATAARICVWIFAFLSAYGITAQFESRTKDETTSAFLRRRWVSLMKGYWFVFLLVFFGMLFTGKQPMEKYDNSVLNMLLDAFALSDFFGTPTMLGTWWYMCFAQLQLLLLPAMILMCKKLGGFASIALVFIGSQYITGEITSPSGGDYLMYTYATLFGILCVQYHFFENIKQLIGYKAVLRVIAVLCVVALGIWLRFVVTSQDFSYNARQINRVSYGVSAVGIALLVFLLKNKCGKLKIGKCFAFLGVHSGNIFMIHMLWVKYFGKYIYMTRNVFLTVVSLLALSCLTSVVLEWLKKTIKYNRWFAVRQNKI